MWQQFVDALEAKGTTFQKLDGLGDTEWLKLLHELEFGALYSACIMKMIKERLKVYGHTMHTDTKHTPTHTHTPHIAHCTHAHTAHTHTHAHTCTHTRLTYKHTPP